MNPLVKLDESCGNIEASRRSAQRALSLCQSLEEIKDFRDQMAAIEKYYQIRKEAGELHALAAEMKIRAERRIGQLILQKHWGESNRGTGKAPEIIDQRKAVDWRRFAEIPDNDFEELADDFQRKTKPLTRRALIKKHRNMFGFTPHKKQKRECKNCVKVNAELYRTQIAIRKYLNSIPEPWPAEARELSLVIGLVWNQLREDSLELCEAG